MRHKKYDFRTAYIDLLLNVLTGMVFLFMITTLLIQTKPKEENQGVKKDAQYIINVKWSQDVNCDVDMWVEGPDKKVASFRTPNVGIMFIERDDQGWWNDIYVENGVIKFLKQNQETWVLRGKQLGEFTLNLHLYSCKIDQANMRLGAPIDVDVEIELIKLNPDVRTMYTETVRLSKVWQEITVMNFRLDSAGNVVMPITKKTKDLVKEKHQ